MSKTLKIGIIGCGGIANGKHMPSLKKQKQVEMVAFCDIVPERAEKAAAEFGAEGAKVYTDFRELLKDGSLDVIHVCTPNDSHAEITVASLDAGKHVMCEKPMAKTTAQAKEMLEAAKRTGKKLTIGYQNRFRNDSLYLKEMCDNGELGDIYYGKALAIRRRAVPTWGVFLDEEKQGGGPLIDIGTHALDLTLWLMDNYKPKSVMGTTFHKLGQRENAANAFGPWDPKEFNVEDSAFGFITMDNGATIILESSWALNVIETGEAKTVLAGTEGGADMKEGLRINGEKMSRLYETNIDLGAGGVAFYSGSAESDSDREARLWVEAVLEDKEPVVKPEQAYVVTQILEAIYESAKSGKAVYFED
ncbi:Predicted dehydrogenase [Paenibacillus uliginis N3/975]|uniref:Predicted dehydrogenase n=1 Tax=Paenibacillus uliginis N3/975 TaxID=1313296 RepID=A0A1X7HJD4_9BACL|nr:Gfo/Idh/MocA family oxidoreductase [Paenibacillus uliginis]SMF87731.1 Predicted dehydrogenase [Paenibacillus uliginis N3/975]